MRVCVCVCVCVYIHVHTQQNITQTLKRMKYCCLHNINGPREYHTKWSKSDRERQIYYTTSFVCGIEKIIQMNLYTK